MKVNGKTIYKMDLESKAGQMDLDMQVITLKVKNMVRDFFNGLIILLMKETLLIILLVDKDYTNGQMEEYFKDNG